MSKLKVSFFTFAVAFFLLATYSIVLAQSNGETVSIPLAQVGDYGKPAAANALCAYRTDPANPNDPANISKAVCDYYAAKRPGASELALPIPDGVYVDCKFAGASCTASDRERMSFDDFLRFVSQPILDYANARPELNITHLAIAKDIPIGVYQYDYAVNGYKSLSAGYLLQFNAAKNTTFDEIYGDSSNLISRECIKPDRHFDPSQCLANPSGLKYRFAVSYLTGQSLADIKKMIDKAQATPPDLSKAAFVIDIGASATSGYDLDDAKAAKANLIYQGVPNVFLNLADIKPLSVKNEIAAYGGRGSWRYTPGNPRTSYGPLWIIGDSSAKIQADVQGPVANRAVIDAYESFFGSTNVTDYKLLAKGKAGEIIQGKISQAFEARAFGGNDYSRSFSGGVGTIDEPGTGGVVFFRNIFPAYASGKTFAESFLAASGNSPQGIAVGDPLMRLQDGPTLTPVAAASLSFEQKPVKAYLSATDDSNSPITVLVSGNLRGNGFPSGSKITAEWQSSNGSSFSSAKAMVFNNDAGAVYPISNMVAVPYFTRQRLMKLWSAQTIENPVTVKIATLHLSDGTNSVSIPINAALEMNSGNSLNAPQALANIRPEIAPMVDAGLDQDIKAKSFPVTVRLSGLAASASAAGSRLSYSWSAVNYENTAVSAGQGSSSALSEIFSGLSKFFSFLLNNGNNARTRSASLANISPSPSSSPRPAASPGADSTSAYNAAVSNVPAGSISFNCPSCASTAAVIYKPGKYTLRLSVSGGGGRSAFDDMRVTATLDTSITIINPNGGESFVAGQTMPDIYWQASNLPANSTIDSLHFSLVPSAGGSSFPLVVSKSSTFKSGFNGNFSVNGYSDVSGMAMPASIPAGQYKLKIECVSCARSESGASAATNIVSDQSDGAFTVLPPISMPSLSVANPVAGMSASAGEKVTIRWTSSNIPSTEKITILVAGQYGTGGFFIPDSAGVPNTGSYAWTVPAGMQPGAYYIQLSCAECYKRSNVITYVWSGAFNIVKPLSPQTPAVPAQSPAPTYAPTPVYAPTPIQSYYPTPTPTPYYPTPTPTPASTYSPTPTPRPTSTPSSSPSPSSSPGH